MPKAVSISFSLLTLRKKGVEGGGKPAIDCRKRNRTIKPTWLAYVHLAALHLQGGEGAENANRTAGIKDNDETGRLK